MGVFVLQSRPHAIPWENSHPWTMSRIHPSVCSLRRAVKQRVLVENYVWTRPDNCALALDIALVSIWLLPPDHLIRREDGTDRGLKAAKAPLILPLSLLFVGERPSGKMGTSVLVWVQFQRWYSNGKRGLSSLKGGLRGGETGDGF